MHHELISGDWIDKVKAPSGPNPGCGYKWWTLIGDTNRGIVPGHIYYAAGFGGNYIVVDEENDLVIALQWIDGGVLGEFVEMVYEAMEW